MVETIVWTKEAEDRFDQVVRYLRVEWTERVAADFVRKTHVTLQRIKRFPHAGRPGKKGTREVLVTKHNLLVYQLTDGMIVVVGFWDTRQHHSRRRIGKLP